MNKKMVQFIFLVFGFIFATVVGTLTHEGGHYIMARMLGYDAEINYAATFVMNPERVSNNHSILITIAGPIETMLTGTLGLILLFIRRKTSPQKEDISIIQWGLIFIALFWLRSLANFFTWIGEYILSGNFSHQTDEVNISNYYNLPDWFIPLVTACIGLMVVFTVVFKFIPKKTRPVFISAGMVGGVSGYIVWLRILGPILMP